MEFDGSLKERNEAIKLADLEFYRVKREKLQVERAKRGSVADKELSRDAINRASAAASRAKLVYLARDLELRTDRLELERNMIDQFSKRLARRLKTSQEDKKRVLDLVRALMELKHPQVSSLLFKFNILHAMHSTDEETSDLGDSSLVSTVEVLTRPVKRRKLRRSPAVDLTGAPSCSLVDPAHSEVLKISDLKLPRNLTNFQSSFESDGFSLMNSVWNESRRRTEHSTGCKSSPCYELPHTESQSRQQQFCASFPEVNRKSAKQIPNRWYDAVRDMVRTEYLSKQGD